MSGIDGAVIEAWRGKRVLVLGDVMLDRFVTGQVERVSPEAPIPVLHFQSETFMLGGAANVARNIVALGGAAVLVGVIGKDASGAMIADELVQRDRIDGRFVALADHPTTVKTRYVSGGQQIMRLDIERRLESNGEIAAQLHEICAGVVGSIAAVVLSDYAKGVLTPAIVRAAIELARAHHLPIVVDPKSLDIQTFAGATVLTPNAIEAFQISRIKCDSDEAAGCAAQLMCERAGVDAVIITRGANGMTIYDPRQRPGEALHVPTAAREVFDVSGAGDTVVAALSLALAAGHSVADGARIANAAAGIAVGKRGTAVVFARELALALRVTGGLDPKIASLEDARQIVAAWKHDGLRVGFTNGCFDLLHPGHVALLKRARARCDRLIVALNSDASVKRLKGETRPVQNERARLTVMASINSVDLVTLFAEDTPLRLIELLQPDVLIKGADYTVETVVGADVVQAYGGQVVLIPLEVGHSTTSIISRANAGPGVGQTGIGRAPNSPVATLPAQTPAGGHRARKKEPPKPKPKVSR